MYSTISGILEKKKRFGEYFLELRKTSLWKRFICVPEKNIKCKEMQLHTYQDF